MNTDSKTTTLDHGPASSEYSCHELLTLTARDICVDDIVVTPGGYHIEIVGVHEQDGVVLFEYVDLWRRPDGRARGNKTSVAHARDMDATYRVHRPRESSAEENARQEARHMAAIL